MKRKFHVGFWSQGEEGDLFLLDQQSDKLLISMDNAYTCADNIVIESFHSLLKKGTIHNNFYKTIEEYVKDVVQWNNYYNQRKRVRTFN